MFSYIFPIFCFGLVVTGVVYLGILEAAEQVKRDQSIHPAETDLPDKNRK
jgi:hypothetical protein